MGKQHFFTKTKFFFKHFFKRFFEDGTLDIAATLAYYFLLSLFPFLIFTFSIIPYLGITQDQALHLLNRYVPSDVMTIIEENTGHLFNKHGGLLSIGVIATLWPASNAVNALIRAMNHAYDVEETRSFIVARLLAIVFTIAMIVVIVATLVINVFGPTLGKVLFSHLDLSIGFLHLWSNLSLLISFLIIIIVFACIYIFAPNKRLRFNEVIVGAVIAAVGWQALSYAFSVYIDRYGFGQYSATYGTLGGIIILMLWFYLTALIIVVGGEINAALGFIKKIPRNK
ncbi:membrane protein [Scopulibacillus darangshiensis]|uniref:Membrane protein n=1 Tax=Scopulibacillus darangshiensis TaxID=442528 RepID=A0A4R2NSJ7_9BACL|nr:YihY/virulence factor BrkB family protein [Scopulibacillus darangshiensis]TCP24521.1 membrane protein [Scopulibacillus darangshiensis]